MKTPPATSTLRVQGHGRVAAQSDLILLKLTVSAENRDYRKTIAELNSRMDMLRRSAAEAGEDPKALKTTRFQVSIENDYVAGRHVFRGFSGENHMILRRPFDQKRLAAVFAAISQSAAKPELVIDFAVGDAGALKRRVLEDAVADARRSAEIISATAGQQLGAILSIEYGRVEIRIASEPHELGQVLSDAASQIEPAEIESTDSVTITWENRERA